MHEDKIDSIVIQRLVIDLSDVLKQVSSLRSKNHSDQNIQESPKLKQRTLALIVYSILLALWQKRLYKHSDTVKFHAEHFQRRWWL